MSFHRRKLAHRRAINRIATVRQLDVNTADGAGSENEHRARAPTSHHRGVQRVIILLLVLLGALLGVWIIL